MLATRIVRGRRISRRLMTCRPTISKSAVTLRVAEDDFSATTENISMDIIAANTSKVKRAFNRSSLRI
jgi:hypothetical protein